MNRNKMHADEVDTDADLVGRLVTDQLPQWADLPIEPVFPRGTDNALYRLGDDKVVRLPRRERTGITLEKELTWLPKLAPHVSVAIPVPLKEGQPGAGYPFSWAVYTWLKGERASSERIDSEDHFARDLAEFITSLERLDTAGGPPPDEHNFFRGAPLAQRDAQARTAIVKLGGSIESDAVTAAWESALDAPAWDRPPVWIHGDLDASNLLIDQGRLSGVIDFGGLGVGDPACDVMVAWKLFSPESRKTFRNALSADDATWERSKGWALSQAVIALAYYTMENHPVLVQASRQWISSVLADRAEEGS